MLMLIFLMRLGIPVVSFPALRKLSFKDIHPWTGLPLKFLKKSRFGLHKGNIFCSQISRQLSVKKTLRTRTRPSQGLRETLPDAEFQPPLAPALPLRKSSQIIQANTEDFNSKRFFHRLWVTCLSYGFGCYGYRMVSDSYPRYRK
jgi:hypothetical protein